MQIMRNNSFQLAKFKEKCDASLDQGFLQRRYIITFLAFLSNVLVQAQRFNLSFALVDMVNTTETHAHGKNATECPDIRNGTNIERNEDAEFSWNTELQGWILSSTFIGYCITQFPGGILCKQLGVKKMILTNTILGSICNLLSPIAARTDPYLLIATHLLKGLGQGISLASFSLLSARWFPKPEKGFLSAIVLSGIPVGGFISSAISGPVCDLDFDGGWPLAFYIFGFFGIFVSILIVFFYVENPADDPNISEGELKYIKENINTLDATEPSSTPWSLILTSLSTYSFIISLFGQYWMMFYLMTVHPVFMDTILNIPVKENGLLTSGPQFAQALTSFAASMFSFWINKNDTSKINLARKSCNSLAVIMYVFGFGGIYLSGCDFIWNEFFLFFTAAAPAFSFGGCIIAAVDMTPTYCGPLMGLASTIASLSGFLIPIIIGNLTKYEQTMAQWHKMFIITIGFSMLNGVVFLVWGSTEIQPYDPAYKKDKESLSQPKVNIPEVTSTHL